MQTTQTTQTTTTSPKPRLIHSPTLAKTIHRMGQWAALRHCRNIGIPFEDCYWMMFGRFPKGSRE